MLYPHRTLSPPSGTPPRRHGVGLWLAAVAAASACQEPFDADRHDLRGLRIAALGVEDGVASAAVWSGLGPWHEQAPTLAWTLDGAVLGEGPSVSLPAGTADGSTLALLVTDADGVQRSAQLTVRDLVGLDDLSVARAAVEVGADLSLEARRALESTPVELAVAEGQGVRLTLSGLREAEQARWMSAAGTVLELERDAADFLAEDILLDDGEVVQRLPLSAGLYPGLALVLDGTGGNRWLWTDAAVGEAGTAAGLVRHRGRLLPADATATAAGLIAATLEADDTTGVSLSGVEVVADTAQQEALPCMPAGADRFEVAWIAEGRCPRPEVLGARVVLEVW